jgi:hypothetical protein
MTKDVIEARDESDKPARLSEPGIIPNGSVISQKRFLCRLEPFHSVGCVASFPSGRLAMTQLSRNSRG